jgi:hypothetical protein
MNMSAPLKETFIHRAVAACLLVLVLGGTIAPLAGNEMLCAMDGPAPAPQPGCAACGPAPEPETGPSLKAATCCRFQPPEEAQALSATLLSTPRAPHGVDAHAIAAAIASGFSDASAAYGSALQVAALLTFRLSPARTPILRL